MRRIIEYIKSKNGAAEQYGIMYSFVHWIILGAVVGALCGGASALFLHLLDIVTNTREASPWLLFLLPVGGIATTFLYSRFGKNSSRGNNLILEEIQNKKEKIPFRMGVLVLISTLSAHLFGGSVGREGTAVQMGGSLSESVAKLFRLNERDRRVLLMSGISGGFGSVFGTPLAGAVFGMEVSSIGAIRYEALIPCLTASIVGDIVTRALGVGHAQYVITAVPALSALTMVKVLGASILFGWVAVVFSESIHFAKRIFAKIFKNPYMRIAAGGAAVILITTLLGTTIYNGIGTKTISEAFAGEVPQSAFIWKIIFTALSLGSGFHGGEVTPIFFTGAVFGNMMAPILDMPVSFLAGLGLIAVFAGAANAPIACFVLGIELFGGDGAIYYFIACVTAYIFSGHHGIYTSQTVATAKSKLLQFHEGSKIGEIEK